jgi:hypothetical protein
VVQIQQVVSEYRVPHQVYDNREEDVLRFGNDKNVVERVAPIPVDVFNASINDRVAEQLVGRNRGNIGPYVDRNGTWRADFEARPRRDGAIGRVRNPPLVICALAREKGTPLDFRQRVKLRRTHIAQFQPAVPELADIDCAREDFDNLAGSAEQRQGHAYFEHLRLMNKIRRTPVN